MDNMRMMGKSHRFTPLPHSSQQPVFECAMIDQMIMKNDSCHTIHLKFVKADLLRLFESSLIWKTLSSREGV